MDLLQRARNPWGQDILVRVSWDLLWFVVIASAVFLAVHLILRRRWLAKEAAAAAAVADDPSIPDKVVKHTLPSRLFHWAMAASMLVLLFTGFLPVVGIQFSWLKIHWIAGLVLIGSIVFHLVHVVARMSFVQVWVGARDVSDWIRGLKLALTGRGAEPAKAGKYAVENKLFHHAAVVTSLAAMITGVVMMWRIETPIFARNPYMYEESTWGVIYVIHGVSSLGLIGLVVAHIYFAILPEKRWMTWSMIRGWIGRREYLAHHDPERWKVGGDK